MWNRRKEEENAPRYTPTPSPAPASEGLPMQTMPARFESEPTPSRTATIGKGVSITGQIFSKEDLIIDGEVEGTIEANEHKLTIGPNGKVKASVKAKDIVVLGIVQGNVEASERMEIRKDARLVGDIKTARISIEDGAIFKGSIDIVRNEVPAKAAPKPAMQPQAQAAAATSTAAGTQQPLAAKDGKH
jgi:cytoskeletal protein CcmA (bactofilin family)